jgi:hypothetical protein
MLNKDDVIRLARQVNNTPFDAYTTPELFGSKQIMAFAKLIAEHEREACAKYVEGLYVGETPLTIVMGAIGDGIRARGQA